MYKYCYLNLGAIYAKGLFVCQPAGCQKAIEAGQRFSLKKAFIIHENDL